MGAGAAVVCVILGVDAPAGAAGLPGPARVLARPAIGSVRLEVRTLPVAAAGAGRTHNTGGTAADTLSAGTALRWFAGRATGPAVHPGREFRADAHTAALVGTALMITAAAAGWIRKIIPAGPAAHNLMDTTGGLHPRYGFGADTPCTPSVAQDSAASAIPGIDHDILECPVAGDQLHRRAARWRG